MLAIVASLIGCTQSGPEATSEESAAAPRPVAVQVARAQVRTLHPTLTLNGAIIAIPERTASVSPQLGGWVRKLHVVEGQSVRAGDCLVELDPRSAQVSVMRAEAIVQEKQAAVERLKRGYLPEEIAGAKQDADNAAAKVDGLRTELTALKDLIDRHEISPVMYQTKSKALAAAEAAYASAQERVKLLEAGTRPELIAEATGLLGAARADLEQARLALEWCTITSPVSGNVVQLLARQGQFFDRAVPLATVIDLASVFVQIRVPSVQFTRVHLGADVRVEVPTYADRVFSGTVTRISGQADAATGNVIVFATIANSDLRLRPGLSCRVSIALPDIPGALTIPVAAIADNSGTPVVTVIRDGKAFETTVLPGVETRQHVQILKGLAAGDTVATAGGYGLPEGCPVTVVETSSAPAN